MGSVREVSAEGGGGSVCLGKVLPRGGTNDDDIWGRYLGAVGCNVKKLEVVHVGFLRQVTGEKTRIKKWQVLAEGEVVQHATGGGYATAPDLH